MKAAARVRGLLPRPLARAVEVLASRLDELETQIAAGEPSAWPEYYQAVAALAVATERTRPGANGELLTTRDMAERLGMAPKTLRKHAAAGAVRPALKRGKLIRWRGDEAPR